MLAKLLRQYSKVKLINLPNQYDEPRQTKLKEFDIAFSKINKDNFDELNDISYEDVLRDQLYLFPETKINFIISLDKGFKAEQKLSKIAGNDAIYDFPAFIANESFEPSYGSSKAFSRYMPYETFDNVKTHLALMLDEMIETKGERQFVFVKNRYGKDKLTHYLTNLTKRDFITVYGLGFNIILEK
ncbi:hypothetical protein IXZ18_11075 (plasmid) [Campylobacter fetus subsp. venerealis bv. intermedius]|uniref:hypothetical protein n=1 Tax=Campylobacter fetus TaxID=196 RepID=UPI0003D7BC81|nr:hypothetical protein [Campylobacter fetus]AHE95259.1 hypothetical protein CFVI03293_B0010 [Campylobacter fetus subsp. venerealis cfvi03/293]OCS23632.1 hypothetical protein CFVI9825_08200 [Campylobacter fetus subsp. venerealis cfvi9825]WKW30239.1 hypothetical protein IXZ18_11075 [Campylobacter fetus subsp. venerealis bv. intermedius]